VQDLGRFGFGTALESSGVPAGGAFDPWAARAANRLVGNADTDALLELTLSGPTLRFRGDAVVALVGDDFDFRIAGEARMRNESLRVAAGATLEIGRARSGARAWLAIDGGLDLPVVLGSRATELATGFGGHEGRALRRGDVLWCFPSTENFVFRRVVSGQLELADRDPVSPAVLRILPGPDERLLALDAATAFAGREWRVSPRSDRRGVRLDGEAIAQRAPAAAGGIGSSRSIPMLPGAIELTPAGEPIVLGVDAPVTGGYPWIAQLIEADRGRLAHLAPGARVRFDVVELAAAERALAEAVRALDTGVAAR
jgi:biotin-dependent carboxylase-like uncharacterized protein